MPEPTVCTAVVASVGDRVFLLRRGPDRTWPRTWCFPGGRLGHGERLVACAARELEEEVGLRVDPGRLEFAGITECVGGPEDDDAHLIGVVYRVGLSCSEAQGAWNREPDKHDDIGLFRPGRWPGPLMDGTRQWLELQGLGGQA